MLIYSIALNSVTYTSSTIFKTKEGNYNWVLGFILMELSSAGVMAYFFFNVPNLTMSETRYYIFFGMLSVINFYIAYDSFLLLKFRSKKFFQSDAFYAFFTLWTDWMYFFWIDISSLGKEEKIKTYEKQYGSRL